MSDRANLFAALAAHATTTATAFEIRAQPGETFGRQPLAGLMQFARGVDTRAEFNSVLADVARLIRGADPFRGGALALMCGTLVESGGDPGLVFPHLLAELPRHLALARRARERQPIAPGALFDEDPDAARAAAGLTYLLLATMTVICRKMGFRAALRADPDVPDAIAALADVSPEANFVAQVLDLTDGELLVLVPNEQRGFRVVLEAVNYNAHLFTLLQAALIGGGYLAGEAPDEEMVAAATGASRPQRALHDHARFHFCTCNGMNADGTLDMIGSILSMPVEGRPSEIPHFDGVPVLLIAPMVRGSRSWDSGFFPHIHEALRSRVEVVEVLSNEQAATWHGRIKQGRS